MTAIRYGARAGAALLMLGLWAGGSQAIASADEGSADQKGSASAHGARGASQHSAPGPAKRARDHSAASAAVTARARSVAPAPAAVSRPVVTRRSASVAQPPATVAAATVAAANGVATPAPSEATIAVTNWFSSTRGLLNGYQNPLTEALQGVLLEVQRRLFSPAPTVRPMQYTSWEPGDPILGALQYIQPGGAEVVIQLTEAPSFGTVQLLSDGSYTYTPGEDFTGTDTFTAQVTSGGFNILEPLTPRTASVTVNINPSPPVLLTRGYDIKNLTGKGIVLSAIQKERGYESSVYAAAPPQILQPGQTYHVELTKWYFYSYDTRLSFSGCTDISCTGYQLSGQQWRVKLSQAGVYNYWEAKCESGNCVNGSGDDIGPTATSAWPYQYNSVVNLVDPAGTAYTLTGAEGQQQAQVINTVCATNGSTCQFVPMAATEYTTKPQQVYQFTNLTQDNVSVSRAGSETVSATSSFGTTYSTEAGVSFGNKDVFNIVAKETFTSTQSLSNTTQTSSSWSVQSTVQPNYTLTTLLTVPIARVSGDYTAVIGNTTYNLTGVYFDFIDPNASTQFAYTSKTEPVTPTT